MNFLGRENMRYILALTFITALIYVMMPSHVYSVLDAAALQPIVR